MIGIGTTELHLGHLGLFFIIKTYDKQPGHPAAIGDDTIFSSLCSSSWWFVVSRIDDEEDEYDEGDVAEIDDFKNDALFLNGSFSALSRADFTLSSVHTLW